MGKVNTIAFDKTGTLMYGRLDVSDVISVEENIDNNTLLQVVASAEAKSEHPLGKAIVSHAKKLNISIIESDEFKMTSGKGIYACINNEEILCGNEVFLLENNVIIDENVKIVLETLRTEGKASILASKNDKCIGVLAMTDVLRPEAKDMVSRLHSMHTNIVLLTGDKKNCILFCRTSWY